MKKTILAAALFACFGANAVVVTTSDDGVALAGAIDGAGVTIDVASINYIGVATQAGFFTGGNASGLGIDEGIILTSGDASDAAGPNSSTGTSTSLGTAGDADLLGLAGASSTADANILEFEFTTDTGDLFFDFVFASEEYNEYLGFIDPFGLFVNGQNIAIAPDGQEISVGTVNCGASGIDAAAPNCSSFNNNVGGLFNIEYDGFTDVFTASVTGLSAGTHTMKFAISDANDGALDSAVFIEANSFSSVDPTDPPTDVPVPATLGLLAGGLLLSLRRKFLS